MARPRAVLANGRVQLEGAPTDLIEGTRGRVWQKTIDREDFDDVAATHNVISSRLFAGSTIVHVMADKRPIGFDPVDAGLQDVYFTTLADSRAAQPALAA